MSLEAQARRSLDMVVARLREDLDSHFQAVVHGMEEKAEQERLAAIDEARRVMEAGFDRRVTDTLEAARAAWEDAQRDRLVDLEKRWNAEADDREASAVQAAVAAVRSHADADAARQVEAGLAHARDGWERVLSAFDRIESASSLTATLDALADAVAGETRRSMVLLLRDGELRAWRLHGFGDELETVGLRVPWGEAGRLGEAVRTRTPVHVRGEDIAPPGSVSFGLPEVTSDHTGIAVPVTIGPDAVAVVYADDGGAPEARETAGWSEVVQMLARHASRHLAALTAMRAAHVSGILRDEGQAEAGPRGFGGADDAEEADAVT